jgi:response regulator RpfG family c-di-GMP phosphodiesterase
MTLSTNEQRRVLLIDHDPRRQHLRAVALRTREVEVDSANDVNEALRLCSQRSYDLVLLAAEENSEQASLFSSELNKKSRRQRGKRRSVDAQPTLALVIRPTAPTRVAWQLMLDRLVSAG